MISETFTPQLNSDASDKPQKMSPSCLRCNCPQNIYFCSTNLFGPQLKSSFVKREKIFCVPPFPVDSYRWPLPCQVHQNVTMCKICIAALQKRQCSNCEFISQIQSRSELRQQWCNYESAKFKLTVSLHMITIMILRNGTRNTVHPNPVRKSSFWFTNF